MDTKKLRQKILDLAIHGRLVPQDPADEPASVLLDRIRQEKERLAKEGKIRPGKKPKATADKCHYPYELPEGWKWTTVGAMCDIRSAKRILQSDWKHTGIPFYRAREVVKLSDCGQVNNELFISEELYEEYKKKYGVPQTNDMLVSAVGTIGATYIVKPGDVFYYKDASVLCLSVFCNINVLYLQLLFKSSFLKRQMYSNSRGTTVDTITIEKASNYIIPLPPFAEQHRIVAEVERWFALIDEIEQNKTDLQTAIKQAKAKVLDLAIHGKLVSQNPEDEPAIELLRRINPHFVPCDNGHYRKLPKGWAKCLLEDVVEYEQPQAYIVSTTNYDDSYTTPVLTAGKSFVIGHTSETVGICKNIPVVIFDDFTTDSKYVDFPFKVKSSAMKILHTKGGMNIKYLALFMSITHLIGNTHKRYWISEYSKLSIPIPPLAEQERIVASVGRIYAELEAIAENL